MLQGGASCISSFTRATPRSRSAALDVALDHRRRGTARVRRRDRDVQRALRPVAAPRHLAHDPQVDHRQHRDLGIGHVREPLPDRRRHHRRGERVDRAAITTSLPGRSGGRTASRPADSRGPRCGGRSCRRTCIQASAGGTAASPRSARLRPRRATARAARPRRSPSRRAAPASSTASGANSSPVYGQSSVDRALHARVALGGAVAQADDPLAAALDVVRHLARALGGDRGDALVVRAGSARAAVPGARRRRRTGAPW